MADYVDKQKLMKNFGGYDLTKCQKYGNTSQKQRNMSYDTMMMYEIAEEIESAPVADVAPVVHGRWECGCQCSVCGDRHGPYNSRHRPYYNYCPNCGAKMDEVSGDE